MYESFSLIFLDNDKIVNAIIQPNSRVKCELNTELNVTSHSFSLWINDTSDNNLGGLISDNDSVVIYSSYFIFD
jgi:hypothetical protein